MPKPIKLEEEVLVFLHYIVRQLGEQTWMLQKILKILREGGTPIDQAKIDKIFAQVEENKKLLAAAGKSPAV